VRLIDKFFFYTYKRGYFYFILVIFFNFFLAGLSFAENEIVDEENKLNKNESNFKFIFFCIFFVIFFVYFFINFYEIMVNFTSDIQNSDIQNINIQNSDIQNSDIQNVNIQNSDIQNVNIQNVNIQNIDENLTNNILNGKISLMSKEGFEYIDLLIEKIKRGDVLTVNEEKIAIKNLDWYEKK
jgi:predicted PurR-regulated permease PerM